MMIEMFVTNLSLDPSTQMPFIIMKDREEKYCLPIWIGIYEASAIALELEGIKPTRPMTHDLLGSILVNLGITVKKVEIKDVKESTFFATITLEDAAGKSIAVDSRPSDAIAVALRSSVPIYVKDEVISSAKTIDLSKCSQDERLDKDRWSEVLENLAPDAFGKYKM